jgi:hypothetical protein
LAGFEATTEGGRKRFEARLKFCSAESLVISIDEALITECKRAGVAAQNLWEVIA